MIMNIIIVTVMMTVTIGEKRIGLGANIYRRLSIVRTSIVRTFLQYDYGFNHGAVFPGPEIFNTVHMPQLIRS